MAKKAEKKLARLKAIPLFFVYCRMRFLILGRLVGKRKKNGKIKLEKESGTKRPSTSASYLWSLKTTRCGYKVNMAQWRKEKSTSLLESNENREKKLRPRPHVSGYF